MTHEATRERSTTPCSTRFLRLRRVEPIEGSRGKKRREVVIRCPEGEGDAASRPAQQGP